MVDELPPAPLDAYVTAKPDEPTFTLQGGDPLAPFLVELWVIGARGLTGLAPEPNGWTDRWIEMQETNQLTEQRDIEALRVRATAAEEVLWAMQEYQKHGTSIAEAEPENSGENSLDEKARLDLHDLRVRYAQKISSMIADLHEMRAELHRRGGIFCGERDLLDNDWLGAILHLAEMNKAVEPRRMMKS